MPSTHPSNLFWGYSVELLMEWCCVGRSTAINLKNGQKPSKRVLKLFELHRDGRVLDQSWDGWRAYKGKLYDPEGHETSQAQLRAWPFVWQLAQEYGRQNAAARDELTRLISWQLGRAAASHGQPERLPGLGQDAAPRATTASRAKPSGKESAAQIEGSRRTVGTLRQRGPKGRPSGKGAAVITAGYEKRLSHSQ